MQARGGGDVGDGERFAEVLGEVAHHRHDVAQGRIAARVLRRGLLRRVEREAADAGLDFEQEDAAALGVLAREVGGPLREAGGVGLLAAEGGAMSGVPERSRPTSAVGSPQPRNVANGTCTQWARVASFATSWCGTAAQNAATDPGPTSTVSPPKR
nr:hypothetical protein GCM10025732_45050 [Glycomyces mayteni]